MAKERKGKKRFEVTFRDRVSLGEMKRFHEILAGGRETGSLIFVGNLDMEWPIHLFFRFRRKSHMDIK